jgi:hypothetical protein
MMPVMVACTSMASLVRSETDSPTVRLCVRAVPRSTAICVAFVGMAPSVRVSVDTSGSGTPMAMVGAWPLTMALPVEGSISVAMPWCSPMALRTPGTLETVASVASEIWDASSALGPPWALLTAVVPCTETSVLSYTLENRRSNVPFRVSVSTRVPATNATEIAMANVVRSKRNLRAKMLLSVTRNMAQRPWTAGSKVAIFSSTEAAVGDWMLSTMRPSARNSTRSA